MMKDEIIELLKEGVTFREIIKKLGCTRSMISYYSKKFKIENKNIQRKLDEETIKEIKKLYEETRSCLKVAKLLKISKTSVLKYVETYKVEKMSIDNRKKNLVRQVIYWRVKAKSKLVEYKGGKCEKCGYNKCVDALDFHHRNPDEKDFSIGGKSWSFERLKNEVDKCILVCANCHREIHYNIKKEHTETN